MFARAAVKALGSDVFGDLIAGTSAGRSPRLGSKDLLKAYSTSPWLQAAVNKCAADVASLTWTVSLPTRAGKGVKMKSLQLARQNDRGRLLRDLKANGDLRDIPNHPILETMAGGENPYFQGYSVIELTQIFLDLVGEGAWLLDRNPAQMPTTSYPIPPTWVADLPRKDFPFYRIDGPTGRRDVPVKDVVWFYHPDPVNPYARGTGPGLVLGDEIETDEFAAKHTKTWFKNRALPDVLVYGEFGPDEKKVIEQTWLNRLQSAAKAWLPFFLNRKITVEKLSQTFENMQLVELRKSQRDLITQIYGVPPEVFGIIENANRATIDAADYLMKRYVTAPRAEFLRSVFQRVLMPQYDDKLIIDYINPVLEDREYELKVMQAFPWAAKLDEIRLRAGLEAIGGTAGKCHVMSFNQLAVEEIEPEPDVEPPAVPPAAPPTPTPPADPKRFRSHTKDLSAADITRLVRMVRSAALVGRGQKVIEQTVQHFGEATLSELAVGITFNIQDPKVLDFLSNWGAEKITGEVNETTKAAIRETLREGVDAGETMKDLRRRIEDAFDDAEGPRANLIARTETAGASNFGAWASLDQAGIEEKEWLSTQDNDVRDTHVELDGQRVKVNEEFESPDGGRAMYPGGFGEPAEDCNCRCGVVAVIGEASAPARMQRWKTLEADRRPWERAMRRAMRAGFSEQRADVLALFDDLVADKSSQRPRHVA